ncbi:hypothetical protein HY256_12375 [Candidatus Sumerlaeota bacterium]|nr:hypothetical protein [Candidatus Sumerlaeota bacterium]
MHKLMEKGMAGISLLAGLIFTTGLQRCAADDAEPITYNKHIAKIFQSKCQTCHRPNQLAPMSLLSYQETRPWVKAIKKAVTEKKMPPWGAAPGYGPFNNDPSLTPEELGMIVSWADQGAPEGNPSDLPEPVKWNEDGWLAGVPDVILKTDRPYIVRPTGENEDLYQFLVVPTNFKQDTWINGIEYNPDNKRVVHHIIGFIDTTGQAAKKDAETPEPGFACGMAGGGFAKVDGMLSGWAPGTQPSIMPKGMGKLIKAGSDIVLQMHYFNRTSTEQPDNSAIGFHLAHGSIHKMLRIYPVSAWSIYIPAGEPNAEHRAKWDLPEGITLYSIMPHMHFIGKDMTISLASPDGAVKPILEIPHYDFNWQLIYSYAEPMELAKRTQIQMVAHHDNSDKNPANPSKPPIDVHWGESTTEEMAIAWIGFTYQNEDLKVQIP